MADAKITITVDGASYAVDALGNISSAAKNAGQAIGQAGDASTTSSEKVSALRKAVDDLKPSMDNATAAFSGAKTTMTEVWNNPTAAVGKFTSAAAIDLTELAGTAGIVGGAIAGALGAVGLAAFGLAEHAAATGGALNDLSEKTGVGVETLSRWNNAAKIAGTSVDALANATFMMQKNMEENPTKFAEGLERLNLDYGNFKTLAPEDQLQTLATALKNTEEPAKRTAAGYETMGRQFRDIAPALYKLNDAMAMTADLNPWTAEESRLAEDFEMHVASIRVHFDAIGDSLGRLVLPSVDHFVGALDKLASWTPSQHFQNLLSVMGGMLNLGSGQGGGIAGALGALAGSALGPDGNAFVGPVEAPKAPPVGLVEGSSFQHTDELIAGFLKDQQAAQDKYVKQWQSTEDQIQKIWADTFVAEANLEDGSLKSQLAVLDQRRINERNAAAQEVSEKTRSEDQLGQLQMAIDAKYAALSYNALLASNQKELEAVRRLENDKASAGIEALAKFGETQEKASQKEFENQVKLFSNLKRAQDDYDTVIEGATLSTYDAREMSILRHLENERQALMKLGGDWQQTFNVMADTANAEIDAIEWEHIQDKIDETDRAMEAWVNKSIHLFGQLGSTISQVAGINLSPLLQAFGQTNLGTEVGGVLQGLQPQSENAQGWFKVAQAGAGIVANATEDPKTKGGQVANYAAKGAEYGAIAGPYGMAIGAGVGAIVGALKVSPEELAARQSLEDFDKQFGSMDAMIKAVGASYALLGKTGVQAEADIKAALDASHRSAEDEATALAKINGVLTQSKQRAADVDTAIHAIGPAFSAVVAGASKSKDSLASLGQQAVTDFTAMLAGGMSVSDAMNSISPALSTIQKGYTDLGADVDNVALKNLLMQNTVVSGNPDLIKAISGLASEMEALDKLGVINIDTLAAMEKTGFDTYTTLQGKVAAVGGTTKDALLPMQGFLRDAADEAANLGIPLDANTQMLVDQSKELGIWKDAGKDSTKALNDSMQALVDKVGALIDKISGTGGITDAISHIPRNVDVSVNGHYNAPDLPGDSNAPGAWTGGVFASSGLERFSSGGIAGIGGWGSPSGTDTIRAWVSRDEMVLTTSQQNAVGALMKRGGVASSALESSVAAMHLEMKGLRADLRRMQATHVEAVTAAVKVSGRR